MSILDFLGLQSTAPEPQDNRGETDTVRKIVARLDGLPEDKARFVAAFAFMLSHVGCR